MPNNGESMKEAVLFQCPFLKVKESLPQGNTYVLIILSYYFILLAGLTPLTTLSHEFPFFGFLIRKIY